MDLTYSLCLPRDSASVPLVRHICRATLQALGVDPACVEDIGLAVTEACSNVLRHAWGQDEYDVAVTVTESTCTIEVRDKGDGSPHHTSGGDWLTGVPEGGRGIYLMKALVDELKFTSLSDGTVVTLTKSLVLRPTSLLHLVAGSDRSESVHPTAT
jgi:serine/threonine-protein kinase RsbW